MTSLLIDGDTALREGVRHLVEVHDYRRIAFLAGPAGNPEAQARLRVYRGTLAGYDLAPPDELIAPGDFKYEAGVDAVAILLDQRGVAFDAIVVANDQMALGVIDALRARGVRVPRDIAIIGFDDIQESRYTAPPLTTIRQPLRQQGRLAIETLLRRLSGEPVPDVLTLPTELVIRRSCGCYSDARRVYMTGDLDATSIPGRDLGVDHALRNRRPQILEAMTEAVAGLTEGIPDAWESDLLDALVGELQGGAVNAFADRVNALLERVIRTGATGSAWQPALSALRRELVPCLASDPVMRSRAEALLQEARVLVGDAVEHSQAQHRLTIERRARTLSDASEALSAAFDLPSLADALRDCLPRLGIPSAFVVLDDDGGGDGARVAFAHDSARDPKELETFGDARPGRRIAPAGLLPVDHTYGMAV